MMAVSTTDGGLYFVSISNLFQFVRSVEHVGDVLGGLGLRLGLEGCDLHGR